MGEGGGQEKRGRGCSSIRSSTLWRGHWKGAWRRRSVTYLSMRPLWLPAMELRPRDLPIAASLPRMDFQSSLKDLPPPGTCSSKNFLCTYSTFELKNEFFQPVGTMYLSTKNPLIEWCASSLLVLLLLIQYCNRR